MSTVYISFMAEIYPEAASSLLAVTFDQIAKGASHIYYIFSTPGGTVSHGIALYNTIKSLPVETTMHNVGNVDSIGNAIFLSGKNRIACPHSTFMFHGVGFNITNQRIEEKDVREKLDGIIADQRKIGAIIADETSLVGEDIDRLFREASTKDAQFALTNGIIQRIEPLVIPEGAPLIQLVFDR